MDKALSFANGVRIGEAWLRELKRSEHRTEHADATAVTEADAVPEFTTPPESIAALEFAATPEPAAAPVFTAAPGSTAALGSAAASVPATLEYSAYPTGAAAFAEPSAWAGRTGMVPPLESTMAALPPNQSPARAVESPGETLLSGPQTPASLRAMRGVTVGSLNLPPAGVSQPAVQRTLTRQAMAAALFVLALTPPIVTSLLLGLSHRANLIPFAPVWAWMAALLALAATVRSALGGTLRPNRGETASGDATNHAAVSWLAPVLLGVLLLVPSAVVLYLRLTLTPTPLRLAVIQVALYVISLVALLLSSPTAQPE